MAESMQSDGMHDKRVKNALIPHLALTVEAAWHVLVDLDYIDRSIRLPNLADAPLGRVEWTRQSLGLSTDPHSFKESLDRLAKEQRKTQELAGVGF